MNLGISAYGPLGDGVIDTPSGLNTYMLWIILEAKKRGDKVFWLQDNLDGEKPVFNGYYDELRKEAFEYLTFVDIDKEEMPSLDSLYIEWRWVIPGRNCFATYQRKIDGENVAFQNDWTKQTKIIDFYTRKGQLRKMSIYDMDYKIEVEDEYDIVAKCSFCEVQILDLSLHPKTRVIERISAPTPFDLEKLKEHGLRNLRFNYENDGSNPDHLDNNVILSYIGNNYERNDIIEKYIDVVSSFFKGKVHFYGNWEKYPKVLEDIRQKHECFQDICFHPRITKQGFDHVYSLSLACPLFLKKDYMDGGVMTQRILEAISGGTIVIGLRDSKFIEEIVQEEMIADNSSDLYSIVLKLQSQNREERIKTYLKQFDYLETFNIKSFYEKLV